MEPLGLQGLWQCIQFSRSTVLSGEGFFRHLNCKDFMFHVALVNIPASSNKLNKDS